MYYVIAKYTSKYGQIIYCAKVESKDSLPDLDNVYIHTLYFKGSEEIKINEIYNLYLIKGENGYTYAIII